MENINTAYKKISEKAEEYAKKYKDYIDVFERKSVVAKTRGVTEADIYALGEQLERFEDYKAFMEADGSKNDLGILPNIALDVITAASAQSPIPLIASIQPINEAKGTIWYKKIVARTTRGNVQAGDTLVNATNGRVKIPVGFAGEEIFGEDTGAKGDGNTTDFAFTLKYPPVNLRSVTIKLADESVTLVDDGKGNLLGVGGKGSINYETGAVSVSFDNAPADGVAILADYATNFEAQTEIPTISSGFDSMTVVARTYALRTDIGLFKSYAMSRRFGINVEETIAQDLTQELTTEVSNNVVMKAYLAAQGVTTWDKTAPAGVSYTEHKLTFFDALAQAESEILKNAGRSGGQTALIAGVKAAAIIRTLPGFQPADGLNAVLGTHYFGMLDGKPVLRSVVLPENEVLLVSKGASMFDASVVYAPYLPLFVTNTSEGIDHNPLKSQKGVALQAGIAVPVKTLITKLVIENA